MPHRKSSFRKFTCLENENNKVHTIHSYCRVTECFLLQCEKSLPILSVIVSDLRQIDVMSQIVIKIFYRPNVTMGANNGHNKVI